jgi:hypothetical protein
MKAAPVGCADAHGYRNLFLSTGRPGLCPGFVGRAILPPDRKSRRFDGLAKFLQKENHPLYPAPGHDECELLPPITKALAEGDSFKAGSDEPQDLVPYLMPVTIVEMLEVIHVHHRDAIVPSQPAKAFFKSATTRNARKFIQVGLSPGQPVKAAQKEEGAEGKENGLGGA